VRTWLRARAPRSVLYDVFTSPTVVRLKPQLVMVCNKVGAPGAATPDAVLAGLEAEL